MKEILQQNRVHIFRYIHKFLIYFYFLYYNDSSSLASAICFFFSLHFFLVIQNFPLPDVFLYTFENRRNCKFGIHINTSRIYHKMQTPQLKSKMSKIYRALIIRTCAPYYNDAF